MAFGDGFHDLQSRIGPILIINLDRQPSRWRDVLRELGQIEDCQGVSLSGRAVRYSACEAQVISVELLDREMVRPSYTLADQLYVEPQPHALPDVFDLERPIAMSNAEIAIACSHIGAWKAIAHANAEYTLVLEDDVQVARPFARNLDEAWREMAAVDRGHPDFDIFYVSYAEVRHGAPKQMLSKNVFRPERGLWYLSGYILSKKGALALLDLLPCYGPIDLWINRQFAKLDVRALRRSLINQRRDLLSTNSYSILPTLSRIGVVDTGSSSLFKAHTKNSPVFAFGPPGSGLSSLAMALSMLGYCCCSDFDSLPESEFAALSAGRADRVFDAYVNIRTVEAALPTFVQRYPQAKYIVMYKGDQFSESSNPGLATALQGVNFLSLHRERATVWRDLCEYLKLAPPAAPYPVINDIGLRKRMPPTDDKCLPAMRRRHDPSPWVAKQKATWRGIWSSALHSEPSALLSHVKFDDDLSLIRPARWSLRNDTFPGNLGLFRPANVAVTPGGGVSLSVAKEPLGVRNFSAAAISSRADFLFGRFEATLQSTAVPGLVTGFFLHRDSPRQEIDVEILGNRRDKLLVNVFYNPGIDGTKFDYGYRGTPALIELGFDASKGFHKYTIEWHLNEIRWLVDDKIAHRRGVWEPTPIPHLPMTLHANTWPTASRELAGRLALRALPASATLRRVAVDAYCPDHQSTTALR
jgi:GR25 family glycosyltransferase involved in LPS biosynthesis